MCSEHFPFFMIWNIFLVKLQTFVMVLHKNSLEQETFFFCPEVEHSCPESRPNIPSKFEYNFLKIEGFIEGFGNKCFFKRKS